MVKVPLDTDTYIVVWTTTPFTVTASRGLTVGADIEYVLVKPAGEDRKFVVASELLNSLSERVRLDRCGNDSINTVVKD